MAEFAGGERSRGNAGLRGGADGEGRGNTGSLPVSAIPASACGGSPPSAQSAVSASSGFIEWTPHRKFAN